MILIQECIIHTMIGLGNGASSMKTLSYVVIFCCSPSLFLSHAAQVYSGCADAAVDLQTCLVL